jgi:uncharacterized DUF497 family protein
MEFIWKEEKNQLLKTTRKVSFEDVIEAISNGKILDVREGTKKYPHQRRFILNINDYPHVVPFFIDEKNVCHLITIMKDRKLKHLIENDYE